MPRQLIVNADDFGYSTAVNAAMVKARKEGVLTSASLMVTGDAAAEAVSIAKDDPGLAVGLHLALSRARSVLPRHEIPDLVNAESQFAANPIIASLKYYFNRCARQQLMAEIEAQFEAFLRLDLPLSHVDGHQHLHAHPAVLPYIIKLAQKYGANGIRIPLDPFFFNMRVNHSHPFRKLGVALGQAYLVSISKSLLRNSPLQRCNLSIGSLMSGCMKDDYVIDMLQRAKQHKIEVYFHPSTQSSNDPHGPNPGDLMALISRRLIKYIEESDYALATYADLKHDVRCGSEPNHKGRVR